MSSRKDGYDFLQRSTDNRKFSAERKWWSRVSFDYFYGQQSDLFTFYRVPKVLFTNERFWNISADAKMLYGILLDRMSLSAKNGWIDKNGRVYIIFTIDEAKMALNCAEQKAIKLLSELEKKDRKSVV